MSAGGAAAAAGAAAAITQALRASGVLVRVEVPAFLHILQRQQEPLVVRATGGFFSTHYRYLTSYKGLAFFTKSATPLTLPAHCEVIAAGSIVIPG